LPTQTYRNGLLAVELTMNELPLTFCTVQRSSLDEDELEPLTVQK